jgi:hypothetical protein
MITRCDPGFLVVVGIAVFVFLAMQEGVAAVQPCSGPW